MSQIHTSHIRNHPRIMRTVIAHTPTLDILTIVENSRILYIADGNKIMSFLAVKNYGSNYELGSIYTYPPYRNQGCAGRLLDQVVKEYSPLGLLCKKTMIPFYEKHGFMVEENCFLALKIRRKLFNIFLAPLSGYPLVSMVYNEKQKR